MEKRPLGLTGFNVSPMCFGTLTLSPLQKCLEIADGARLIKKAYELGVNFYDTAEIYANYGYIRAAELPQDGPVISTKCYAYDRKTAAAGLEKYLRETGRERAEIFMLHEQESLFTLRGHYEAMEYFAQKKREGLIGAFGVSTHFVACARAALLFNEIEVLHPLINLRGIGIVDGTREDMEDVIAKAAAAGRGVYAMKPLGGGHLIKEREAALEYSMGLAGVSSVAIGVADENELEYNVACFSHRKISEKIARVTAGKKRRILIQDWCERCGGCVTACQSGALSITNDKLVCDMDKCVLCGYCGAACKNAAIKVI